MEVGKYKRTEVLKKENLLKYVSQEDIIRRYMPSNFKFNTIFSSPFRVDKKPSFGLRLVNGIVIFKDFKTGETGNAIEFVMKLYNCSFKEVLERIVLDFNLTDIFPITLQKHTPKVAKYENVTHVMNEGDSQIKIIPKAWEEREVTFWTNISVKPEFAHRIGRVVPISGYYLNGTVYYTRDLAFAYCEKKDGEWTYKIYRPYNEYHKWLSNNNNSVIELFDSLPESGDALCITSSRKDALCVWSVTGIPSIAPQGESVKIKPKVLKDLSKRFKKIYLLFDNDYDAERNWGQENAVKFIADNPTIPMENIVIDTKYKSKDPTDLQTTVGKRSANEIIRNLFDVKYIK